MFSGARDLDLGYIVIPGVSSKELYKNLDPDRVLSEILFGMHIRTCKYKMQTNFSFSRSFFSVERGIQISFS